ncbi:hypothetical protein JCM3765_004744 [Sporobolomyces pararoseus]
MDPVQVSHNLQEARISDRTRGTTISKLITGGEDSRGEQGGDDTLSQNALLPLGIRFRSMKWRSFFFDFFLLNFFQPPIPAQQLLAPDAIMSETAILSGLTNLPPDTNPYLWIADYVEKSSRPDFSRNAKVQLFVIVGLLSVDVLLMICCIGVRCWKEQFWFFRRRMSKSLIQPNQVNILAVLALVIVGLNILLLLSFVQAIDGNRPDYLGYLTFFFPLFADIAGEILVWGFASTFLIHLGSTDSIHLRSNDNSERQLESWIIACNVVGISTPFLHLAIFTPLGVVGGLCYQKVIKELNQIVGALEIEGSQWKPGETFNVGSLIALMPQFNELQDRYSRLKALWRAIFIFHTVATALLMLSIIVILVPYFNSVRKLIREGKQGLIFSSQGIDLLQQAQQTWTLLVVSKILFFLIACSTFTFGLYYAIRPLDQSQSIVFASFWIQPVLATIAATCVLYHCIKSPADNPAPNKDPPSSRQLPSSRDKSTQITKELDYGFVREDEESMRGPYLTTSFVDL